MARAMSRIAEVIVDLNLDRSLDYLIPENCPLQLGSQVEVAVRGKKVKGIVIAIKNESAFSNLKPIDAVLNEEILPPDLMKLAVWMSAFYVTPLRQVLKTMIPGIVRENKGSKKQFFVSRLKTLEECEEIARELRQKNPAQAEVLDFLLKAKKGVFLSEITEKCSASSIKTLEKKGILKIEQIEVDRSPIVDPSYFITQPKKLNEDQKEALDKIVNSFGTYKTHLLYGITGSGKTEVYLQAIAKVLERGEGALMLIPEISLTEQTIERFRSRFEVPIAILNYRLSDGERRDEWQKIKKGEARIVIGARSSLFAPMPKLGLIIVDEEHEGTFKQSDEAPRYHVRESAIMRAKALGIPVVLGSATPSLESYYNTEKGKFELSLLKGRATDHGKPHVTIVDMKDEYKRAGQFTLFSEPLLEGIKKRYQKGEQTLIFLNRRGYHSYQLCPSCGEAVKCHTCDTTLTFHKQESVICCHLCGVSKAPLRECPSCKGAAPLKFKGFGTELVESSLKAIFPDIRTLRMDADTTRHKGSHQKLFRDFGKGKADVLIGTQMIAKGLHFPEVSLVGVINCDMSLHLPDFRASEMTFQLLTQVAGRAGRGSMKGEVIFQTLMPDNRTLHLAKDQDYLTFYKEELEVRKMFNFPPFSFIAKISARSESEKGAFNTLEKIRCDLIKELPPEAEWLPAVAAGHAKVKNIYKFNSILKGPMSPILTVLSKVPKKIGNVLISIDINPQSTFF